MRKSFITGLIILLPIAVTFFLVSFILDIFTSPFLEVVTPFLDKFQDVFPFLASKGISTFIARILIILLFFISIFLLGILGRWFLFRALLSFGNAVLMKIPLFKSIYHTTKDMVTSLLSIKERKAFKCPVMVKFPSNKSSCIGFLSGEVPKECKKAGIDLEPVFVPTAPHPISGYLIFVPKKEVKKIKMTNEEAVKFTVSCGVITPETIKKIKDEK